MSSARVWSASAPCPGAGTITSEPSGAEWGGVTPRRMSPASASTAASTVPSPTFRRRVSTLPRRSSTVTPGNARSSCARRRMLDVPITAPGGSEASCRTSTSAGSTRGGTAAMTTPSSSSAGRSFAEWTATSISSRSRASRIVSTNSPFSPAGASRDGAPSSPDVDIGTISASVPCSASRRRTSSACTRASGERRVPIRSVTRRRGRDGGARSAASRADRRRRARSVPSARRSDRAGASPRRRGRAPRPPRAARA